MNGIHDMGGMHGFGPIAPERDEPVFHERWEARMFGLRQAMTFPPGMTIDKGRFEREQMPPVEYLSQSYYEHWYYSSASALLKAGYVTCAELRTGRAEPGVVKRADPRPASSVAAIVHESGKTSRTIPNPPSFAIDQSILTRNLNPAGHTRLPRYARGKRGRIHRLHGAHVFADSSARGDGEQPQHLYSVAISARELWGADAARDDKVFLDLWESYLDTS